MGKYEKLLDKWKNHVPPQAPKEEVFNLARHFGLLIETPKRGSHYLLRDIRLTEYNLTRKSQDIFDDCFTIPVSGGKYIKNRYIKRLVDFIEFITEESS